MIDATQFLTNSATEKFELGQCFIKSYLASREGLKRLAILRSDRTLQGDYAEWLVAELMGLKLAENTVQKGYDAMDAEGNRYQVKSRLVSSLTEISSFNMKNADEEFDYLICVFFSRDMDLLGVIQVAHEDVKRLGHLNQNSFRFRWNKRVANDPRIKRVYWPNGSEDCKEE
jgi:hypothetical protein